MSDRDDMVITPHIGGVTGEGDQSSERRHGRPRGGRAVKASGNIIGRLGVSRRLQRTRAARMARFAARPMANAGKMLTKAGGISAVLVAVIVTAVRLKSGKTFGQQGQAVKDAVIGDKEMRFMAKILARDELAGLMDFGALAVEGARADRAKLHLETGDATTPEFWRDQRAMNPTHNRLIEDYVPMFEQLTKKKFHQIRGIARAARERSFANNSDVELWMLRAGVAMKEIQRALEAVKKWVEDK